MAQKYKEKLLASSGVSNKKFESEFGLKMLEKMGWQKGNGLGKTQSGRKECIQIKRRDEGLGLGVQSETDKNKMQWNNNWWEHSYNNAIKSLDIKSKKMSINSLDTESETPHTQTRAQAQRKLSCSSNNTEIEGEILRARLEGEKKQVQKKKIKKSNKKTKKQ